MSWLETHDALREFAQAQIFFLGGAPRSGTTWVQEIIDSHPDACCRGEALFAKEVFPLFEAWLSRWRGKIEEKNRHVFGHARGYPLPELADAEIVSGTAILLALRRQAEGRTCRAHGEKTPENVFLFPRLRVLFPRAKFIGIARDPRDVITSTWHFFGRRRGFEDSVAGKDAFIAEVLPWLNEGLKRLVALRESDPDACHVITYERLQAEGPAETGAIFRFLGLADSPEVIAHCLETTRFGRQTGGREPGLAVDGAFRRKGIVGDWTTTLTPAMNDRVLRDLAWSFPLFGWRI
ncbi:sulfotransferase family protein [Acidisoma sp. 7E03]